MTLFRLFCDRYYYDHQEGVAIHEAAEIAEARRTGRRLGGVVGTRDLLGLKGNGQIIPNGDTSPICRWTAKAGSNPAPPNE